MNEESEKYIILLLGVKKEPIPSLWHLQKEMFMVSRVNPKVSEYFDFEKHYNGPYSQKLQEIILEPLYFDSAYHVEPNSTVILTANGKKIFEDIKKEYFENKKFSDLLKTLKLIREIYDALSKEELLFLIYRTYPEYIEASNVYEKLVINERKRKRLANSLLEKGIITEERYAELLEIEQ